MNIALTIAGSDSGGGAGIQADLKTFHQFGVFGTSVVVAITAQNTLGVTAVHAIPSDMVEAQIDAVATDLPPSAFKTGMLATTELVGIVARAITKYGLPNYVLDPVMVATSGDRLLDTDAERTVREKLVPLATVVTPNLDEASILIEDSVDSLERMVSAGRSLVQMGAKSALVKGGHLKSDHTADVLVTDDEVYHFEHPRIDTSSTHGTGCTLSSAIVACLASGKDLAAAVSTSLDYVHRAIASAPGLGSGHGPLNHLVTPGD
ncbi:MAG: bifunctional hydroxymethylpyrimidine kinase/phosphomethylpyrimidine kinase [Gemmatimonadota bacterium]|nr:MAG: bifunctional hydroxymethylpyrimidine kinase/phosphomethylpyrimidine kinase [Gemmatimonadota bacterium]